MKNKIISISFVFIIIGFFIFSFILKDELISYSERRTLTKFPKLNINTILDGDFFEELSNYLTDHFPYRDEFRKLKGIVTEKIYNKKENNGVFIKDDFIFESSHNINENSINHFTNKLNYINDTYLYSNNIYYSIIPDKNYYLEDNNIPKINYEYFFNLVSNKLPKNFKYIDITNCLNLDSYYKTDIHWKQEKLETVVDKLSKEMNFKEIDFPKNEKSYDYFYGALYGKIASKLNPDKLIYLTNDTIDNFKVYNYEKNVYQKVYQDEYLNNIDSYDIFLSGATALLVIENQNQTNGKELIVFRDSFGSSITPIIAQAYSKITIIDIRYINSSLLNQIDIINFNNKNADILFLYSVPIINNSFTLK